MKTGKSRAASLRRQLALNALVSVTIPIFVAGSVLFIAFNYNLSIFETGVTRIQDAMIEDYARSSLVSRAKNTARHVDSFLITRIGEMRALANASEVTAAARSANARHAGLSEIPVDRIERRFQTRKSLGLWPDAAAFLHQQTAASPYFIRTSITDRNGFNVALTDGADDFVQSDEEWWKTAWKQGISISKVNYDEATASWVIDISVRIDQPRDDRPLGVMKTVLAISPIQKIADMASESVSGSEVQITTEDGMLIAETASGHVRERIVNEGVNVREQGEPSVRASFGGEQTGFSTDRNWLTGYSRTGGRESYSSTVNGFMGFDWIVILQEPVGTVSESAAALRGIEDTLRNWRPLLALGLAAMLLLSAVFSVALAMRAARRYATALNSVKELALRSAHGERVSLVEFHSPREIVQVRDAVHRLIQLFTLRLQEDSPCKDEETID